MKKILTIVSVVMLLIACSSHKGKGKFTVTGDLKNTPDQKIFLEELFFSAKPPEVLDTALLKNGKFSIGALAPAMGLYRLRLEKNDAGFLFINDQENIQFSADMSNLSMQNSVFKSPANILLKNFMIDNDSIRNSIATESVYLQQLKNTKAEDSIIRVTSQSIEKKKESYKKFIIQYIDTTRNPVMAMIAIGHTKDIELDQLDKPVTSLTKRFPQNETISSIVEQFKQLLAQQNSRPHIGSIAPEINLPDTSGKMFSLSSLRGKYVLIDFWASWCNPCRMENPNVVAAYTQYKDKNFTVLSVSLDKERAQWVSAINADKLTWNHVSDLKFWSSAVVPLYGFDSIPYNVLIGPDGKIIALDLKGIELANKLNDILK